MKLQVICNLARKGGNSCCNYLSLDYAFGEQKKFVELVKVHGYDVLNEKDEDFKYWLSEYNRVLELQAKANGLSSYEKSLAKELCVCGDWIFMEHEFVTESKEENIKDARGGQREGAGRKAKHPNLVESQTAVIRIPQFYKEDIKNFVDWLIAKAEQGQDIKSALFSSEIALQEKGKTEEAQLIEELRMKVPIFSVSKQC